MQRRPLGAMMAAVMMLTLAVGLVLAGWITLIGARAQQSSSFESAADRRIRVDNSRMVGRQLMLQKGFEHLGNLTASSDYLLAEGGASWGGVNTGAGWNLLDVFAAAQSPAVMSTAFPYNVSGLRPGEAFLNTHEMMEAVQMSGQIDPHRNYAFMKMICPPLRGDLFTVYRKPASVLATGELDVYRSNSTDFAEWVVNGRMVIKDIESLFSAATPNPLTLPAQTESLYVAGDDELHYVRGTSLNGDLLPASNLGGTPTTMGASSNPDGMWKKELNVVKNDANPSNSVWHMMGAPGTTGQAQVLTITSSDWDSSDQNPAIWIEKQGLDGAITYQPPNWPSGYDPEWPVLFVDLNRADLPHVRILGAVRQIVFLGVNPSDDAAMLEMGRLPPLLITVLPHPAGNTGVQDVRFVNGNNRRVLFGFADDRGDPLELYWEGLEKLDLSAGPTNYKRVNYWRGMFINEFRKVYCNLKPPQRVQWVGGVMTNWLFKRRRSGPGEPRSSSAWAARRPSRSTSAGSPRPTAICRR